MYVNYKIDMESILYHTKFTVVPGENMYGLEVCKYLHMPKHFLNYAHNIRNKYSNQTSILDYKLSRYNNKKIRGKCELCNIELSTETHHLQHQNKANKDNGFILVKLVFEHCIPLLKNKFFIFI